MTPFSRTCFFLLVATLELATVTEAGPLFGRIREHHDGECMRCLEHVYKGFLTIPLECCRCVDDWAVFIDASGHPLCGRSAGERPLKSNALYISNPRTRFIAAHEKHFANKPYHKITPGLIKSKLPEKSRSYETALYTPFRPYKTLYGSHRGRRSPEFNLYELEGQKFSSFALDHLSSSIHNRSRIYPTARRVSEREHGRSRVDFVKSDS